VSDFEELVRVTHTRWCGLSSGQKTLKACPKLSQHDIRVKEMNYI